MVETLASLGEFIGGIAVVVSIVYFAVQLRANSNASRAQALAAWTMAASLENEALFKDPEFSKLYREVVLDGRPAEYDEIVRLYAYYTQYMNTWQLAYLQNRAGVMSGEFLERVSSGYVTYFLFEHISTWWKELGSGHYDAAFVKYVHEKVGEVT